MKDFDMNAIGIYVAYSIMFRKSYVVRGMRKPSESVIIASCAVFVYSSKISPKRDIRRSADC